MKHVPSECGAGGTHTGKGSLSPMRALAGQSVLLTHRAAVKQGLVIGGPFECVSEQKSGVCEENIFYKW